MTWNDTTAGPPMLDEARLLERVRATTGIEDPGRARRATEATLQTILLALPAIYAARFCDQLPPALRPRETPAPGEARSLDAAEIYGEVGAREGVAPGPAKEHVEAIRRVLLDATDPETRRHLERNLPPALVARAAPEARDLPAPSKAGAAPPDTVAPEQARPRRTLASSRPGSERPLSEAGPEVGASGTVAQADSVVEAQNPRADHKISTAGTKPAERGEPLSEGKPGSRRPLSEATD